MAEKNGSSCLRETITLQDVAALCVMSERSVQRLTKAGVIEQAKDRKGHFIRGRYILGDCIPRLFENTRDLATRDNPHEQLYAQARARRMRCAAESAALDLKLKKGELLDGERVDIEVTTILRSLRDNLRGLPAELTTPLRAMDDPVLIRKTLKDAIDRVLRKTADSDISAKLRRELRRHHQVLERDRDDAESADA